MASTMSQKDYLKKYLSGGSKDAKKKKKKRIKGAGVQIIDDDTDLSRLRPLQDSELELLLEDEDAPQVAGIVDERPEEVRKAEEFKSRSKWKVINEDDGFNSRVRIEEIKSKIYRSDNENNSDVSPPRRPAQTQNDDSDQSPIRRHDVASKKHENRSQDTDLSPQRSKNSKQVRQKTSRQSDSDASPPRKSRHKDTSDNSNKQHSDSDQSPLGKRSDKSSNKHKNHSKDRDSDLSPPRSKSSKQTHQRTSRQSDSDASPPRKSRRKDSMDDSRKHHSDSDQSPIRKRSDNTVNKRKSPDSERSPPRKSGVNRTERRRKESRWGKADDDTPETAKRRRSPPGNSDVLESQNRDRNYESKHYERDRSRRNSGSDPSPPRRTHRSPEGGYDRKRNHRSADSPPPTNRKMERTLEGKQAGLQNAKELTDENRRLKEREEDVFKQMSGEVSGRYAEVASRRSGKKRESSVDKAKQREDQEKQKARDEKYNKWGKGLKQTEEQESRIAEYIHESSKPLARYRDDGDLDSMLRNQEREGDPMLAYMREKKGEQGGGQEEKPKYKGPYPANRFNIRPGHRWDGVDRSSGYEKTYFETQSKKKANDADAYKWSVEEM